MDFLRCQSRWQVDRFDLMGDIYLMPITGGKASVITKGLAYDVHPRFSPDGKSLVFISDKSGSDNIWTMDIATKNGLQTDNIS